MVQTACTYCPATVAAQCATCHADLCEDHGIQGQQLITARQMLTVIVTTALRAPMLLGEVLLKEIDQVTYCQSCRVQLSEQRRAEQSKFSAGMLVVLVLVMAAVAGFAYL